MIDRDVKLLVVIVNFRLSKQVCRCLDSLEPELRPLPSARVVVVDNASGDGSVEMLRSHIDRRGWESRVSLLISERNDGFAYGNNLALRRVLDGALPADYVYLLNPDTILRPGAVAALLDFMAKTSGGGITGSRLENEQGEPRLSTRRFPGIVREFERAAGMEISARFTKKTVSRTQVDLATGVRTEWVPGASILVRRAVLEEIGLMDERFFLYYEETDFCLRAARAGWSCWIVPKSRVVHFPGSSTGVTGTVSSGAGLPGYWYESRRWYFVKNYGWFYAIAADAAWLAGYAVSVIRAPWKSVEEPGAKPVLRDFLSHCALVALVKSSRPAP